MYGHCAYTQYVLSKEDTHMYHIYYLTMAWHGRITQYTLAATMREYTLSLTMQ
jgi:hypothetical protein